MNETPTPELSALHRRRLTVTERYLDDRIDWYDRHFDRRVDALSQRLDALEELHRHELAGMPQRPRDSLAPSPDYRVSEPPLPDPEPCGCEEAEALRLQVASLMTELAQGRAMLRSAEAQCEIEIGKAAAERRQRIELKRAFATFALDLARSGGGETMPEGAWVPDCVAALVGDHANKPIGACDRCGKRAPLREQLVDSCEAPKTWDVCAWGCEVTP
jgi:hypothetical protein